MLIPELIRGLPELAPRSGAAIAHYVGCQGHILSQWEFGYGQWVSSITTQIRIGGK